MGTAGVTIYRKREGDIVKSNDMAILGRTDCTFMQKKILDYVISFVDPFTSDVFPMVTFTARQFFDYIGKTEIGGREYADLEKAVLELSKKAYWVWTEKNTKSMIRWVETAVYRTDEHRFSIQISPSMSKYLLHLEKNYFRYNRQWSGILHLAGAYALYERCCEAHYHSDRDYEMQITVCELERLLSSARERKETPSSAPMKYSELKRHYLMPAMQEINEKTDKNVELSREVKTGNKVSSLCITIQSKTEQEIAGMASLRQEKLNSRKAAAARKKSQAYMESRSRKAAGRGEECRQTASNASPGEIQEIIEMVRLREPQKAYVTKWSELYTAERIKAAYETTVLQTGKMSFQYMDRVLENNGNYTLPEIPDKRSSMSELIKESLAAMEKM